MKNDLDMGMNRSGLATAPRLAPQVLQVPGLTPRSSGNAKVIANERVVYAKQAEPLATMPPPGSLKELAKTTMKLLKGQKAMVFVDKVAERMAFERGGVRLYEALLSKHDAYGTWEGGPTRADLEGIMRDELQHFHFLAQVLGMLGADATAVTPSADVHDVMASGMRLVLTDPRTDLRQCLEAMMAVELADNECWTTLVKLALGYGETQLAERLQRCLEEERVHASRIRAWLTAGLAGEAFGDPRALQLSEPWVEKGGVVNPRMAMARGAMAKAPARIPSRNGNGNPAGTQRRGRNVQPKAKARRTMSGRR